MAIAVLPAPGKTWTTDQLERVMIELLANLLDTRPNELARQLQVGGTDMPVDSLDLFDILVEFRQITGLTVAKRGLRKNTMNSVHRFAQYVVGGAQ